MVSRFEKIKISFWGHKCVLKKACMVHHMLAPQVIFFLTIHHFLILRIFSFFLSLGIFSLESFFLARDAHGLKKQGRVSMPKVFLLQFLPLISHNPFTPLPPFPLVWICSFNHLITHSSLQPVNSCVKLFRRCNARMIYFFPIITWEPAEYQYWFIIEILMRCESTFNEQKNDKNWIHIWF